MKKRNFLFWFGGRIRGSSSFSLSKLGSLNIHPDACHCSRRMIGFKVRISLIYYSIWSCRWNSFMQLQIRKPRHSLKRTLSNQMQLFLHPNSALLCWISLKKGKRRTGENLEWSLHPFALTDQLRGEKTPRNWGEGKTRRQQQSGAGSRERKNPHSQRPSLVPSTSLKPSHSISTMTFQAGVMLQKVKSCVQGHTASRDLKPVGLTANPKSGTAVC